jgi:hypothetical protein
MEDIPELEGIDSYILEDFFKSVNVSKNKILNTTSLLEAVKKFYHNEQYQIDILEHILFYLSSFIQSIDNILITNVAGDGRCLFYAGFSHLIHIGTFSISLHEVGLSEDDLIDDDKNNEYKLMNKEYIENICAKFRDDSIHFYNCLREDNEAFRYLPIIDENTSLCSPHLLLYLSITYSMVFIIIHYEDGVNTPTIVNGVIDDCEINDYSFILCKGGHAYGLFIPDKNTRKYIYEYIINEKHSKIHPCQFICMK